MASKQDEADIAALIARFYSSFDNREGAPSGESIAGCFAFGAMITRCAPSGVETMGVEDFVAPRLALLGNGRLTNFHEWETAETTIVTGNIGSRISTYEKMSVLDGRAHKGSGRKIFSLCRHGGWRIAFLLWEDDESMPSA